MANCRDDDHLDEETSLGGELLEPIGSDDCNQAVSGSDQQPSQSDSSGKTLLAIIIALAVIIFLLVLSGLLPKGPSSYLLPL